MDPPFLSPLCNFKAIRPQKANRGEFLVITEPQPKKSEHKVSNTWLDKTGKEYCLWLDKQPLANHSKRTYESRLTAFVDFLIWEQRTAPITEQTKDAPVRAFRHYLKRTRKVKPATVNSYIAAINNFYGFLGIGATTVHPEDLPTEASAALPKEDQKKLLRAIETTPRIKDRAILTLLFFTGIRISECAALEMDDVFVVGRKTKIIVRAGKGDHYREIPLNSLVCEVLLKWISERRRKFEDRETSDAFFVNPQGKALTTSGIDLIVRKVGQSCGLDLSAHQLRHTLLTNLVRNNKDIVLVADVAGHRSLNTTRRYALPTVLDKERALEELID